MIIVFKILKSVLRRTSTLFSTFWTRLVFRANGIRFGRKLKAIGIPSVNVSIGGKAEIGNGFYIRTGNWTTEIGSVGTRIRVGRKGRLKIGNSVGMSNVSICCDESVTIGDNVLLGGGVQIFDTNFHSTDAALRTSGHEDKSLVRTAPVVIGPRAFIGTNAIICKGVTIGPEALIAAGSVVAKSVPPGETWGGNPAKRLSTQ